MLSVTVYTRPGCHLCDEALESIVAIRDGGVGLKLRTVDIEGDDRLHATFLERIPVVEVEGRVVAELESDEAFLRAAITSPA